MSQQQKKFYITTPVYYVNDRMHLGHAYTTIAADILARYHRLKNERVFFLTGTDEHGGKIEQTAKELNKDPQQLCDENSQRFKEGWQKLNISYDNFIRTTDASHEKAVTKALEVLHEKGLIYKGVYKGLYCLGCEQYKTKSDLVDGKCPDHKTEPEIMEEESYLFRLSKFSNEIEKRIKNDEFKIRPKEKRTEILEFLKKGLKDISVSREKVKWGIPLPFEPQLTSYVWVDAFLNYLTGIGWEGDPKRLPEFWPPEVQLMAKDIFRVHTTIWPALLLGLGIPLPKKLFIHGYFTVDGQKMSKSLGNVIWPEELIEKFGVDATRYLLLSSFPFGRDGDISWKKLEAKYDADLAKGIGNLVARIVALAEKLNLKSEILDLKEIQNTKFQAEINKTREKYKKALEGFKLNEALISIWELISFCDKYIEKEKVWEKKGNQKTSILNLLYTIGNIARMSEPFLPETSEKIFEQLKTRKSKPLFPRPSYTLDS
ncbi:MAG: methionine--tRNA ligase [Candidatus Paceibacterales bacterium]